MNSYRLEGENFDIRQKNAIWAFTPGELTATGWLSEKSPNVDQLVEKSGNFDYLLRNGKSKNRMTLAVPDFVRNISYKKGLTIQKFLIHFHDRANVTINPTPWRTISFYQIVIIDNKRMDFSKIPNIRGASANYSEVLVEIKNGFEFHS